MLRISRHLLFLAIFTTSMLLMACGSATGRASSTPTSAATATATATTPSGCAAASGFASAGVPNLGAHFGDVSFPSGAISYNTTTPETNGFQFRLVHTCVVGLTPAALRNFYNTHSTSQGWSLTDTVPVNGDLSTACPTPAYCWIKNDGVIRFLNLEDVASAGSVTTYTLRLIIEPLASGGALLNPGDTYDFDPTGPGSGANDLTWTGSQLTLASGVTYHAVGSGAFNTVGYADVAGYTYGVGPVPGSALAVGAIFAVQTGDHHFVKVRVVNHAGSQLNVEAVTYPYTF
ncbi:MAG: hypothetical protein OJF49_004546 [Ktedonobacterales bacterium]|jgi:hypothetical protein|nr:MAG: hypothetical protein OJF49_004546 [Ktedonobacterales bacterium]